MKQKKTITEARRYVENARKTLGENGELNVETKRYKDDKYVRAAGNYLWLGVLKALDAAFHVRKDRGVRVWISTIILKPLGNVTERCLIMLMMVTTSCICT